MPEPAPDTVLVLNAGSSSIKLTLFETDLTQRLSGMADGIGGASRLRLGMESQALDLPDHTAALEAVLQGLADQGVALGVLRGVGHRVVHGGNLRTGPRALTRNRVTRLPPASRSRPSTTPTISLQSIASRA